MSDKKALYERRKRRNRFNLKKRSVGKVRLCIHRSNSQIYAQLVDDVKGITLASASSLDADLAKKVKSGGNQEAARLVGALIAERAKKQKITDVVFDRGAYLYHGRVKALGEAAREAGLVF